MYARTHLRYISTGKATVVGAHAVLNPLLLATMCKSSYRFTCIHTCGTSPLARLLPALTPSLSPLATERCCWLSLRTSARSTCTRTVDAAMSIITYKTNTHTTPPAIGGGVIPLGLASIPTTQTDSRRLTRSSIRRGRAYCGVHHDDAALIMTMLLSG